MRIALYHNLPSGGAKRHTFEQVRELSRRGHEITEFTLSTADLGFCDLEPYVADRHVYPFSPTALTPRRIPCLTPYIHSLQMADTLWRLSKLNRQIAQDIDEHSYDLVFAKDCYISMLPPLLQYTTTRSALQCHHIPLLSSRTLQEVSRKAPSSWRERAQELYYAPARRFNSGVLARLEERSARSANLVLTNSCFSRQQIVDAFKLDAHVVHPGIKTRLFRPLAMSKQDYVLCVARLVHQKGYRFLVCALARIRPSYRPCLFIAADGVDPAEERVVREMAEQLEVKLHIETIRDDERLVEVYNGAKVFVYAPIQEALGMAPLEAMACGTPVVAVGEGGVRETVLDGMTGWLVQRDPAAFADRLTELLADEALCSSMGAAGVEYVRQQWTWERAVDRLEREMRDTLQPKHR